MSTQKVPLCLISAFVERDRPPGMEDGLYGYVDEEEDDCAAIFVGYPKPGAAIILAKNQREADFLARSLSDKYSNWPKICSSPVLLEGQRNPVVAAWLTILAAVYRREGDGNNSGSIGRIEHRQAS